MTDFLLLLIAPAGAVVIAAVVYWFTRHDADHSAKKGKA
ncbi:hypothetical protein FHS81_003569 [Pseudochelatococcus contaminans]|uniref:Uncharacterized protein n=1 Tax=Pseudochelatococcus contaminans TaxID=1538103 RepID=A0A7W5Z7L7_9HYPH|nr:hypothetical protein [Pseudochelatococcus contaminans]